MKTKNPTSRKTTTKVGKTTRKTAKVSARSTAKVGATRKTATAVATRLPVGTLLARAVCARLGLTRTVTEYNSYLVENGFRRVKSITVERYMNPGDGYRGGPPTRFVEFLLALI